jgi:hypothetical protein
MKKFLFGLFAICLFAYLVIPKVLAQEENYDVTVSPVFFDLSANPGASVSENVRVRNNTNSPISISVEVNKLTGDETGALTITEENDDASSLDWFSFEQEEYTLSPLEWTNIPFTITVPETAAYGYYYTINFSQAGVEETGETGATITGAAAVPVLLEVRKDGSVAEAKLVDFSVGNYINEYLPVSFKVELENTGNVHIRPRGNIFISGNGQENINTIEVNEGNGAIIPDTKRLFNQEWANGFIVREPVMEDGQVVVDGNGNAKTRLKVNWNQLTDFRFGKYTANLIMVYDNGERDVPIEASAAFWVIPYKVIIGGIILIIVVILVIRWALRRYINREVKKRSTK